MSLFKQYKLPYIGAIKDIAAEAMFWIGGLNFMLVVPTAYTIWAKDYLSFPVFIGVLIALVASAMFVEYKFIMKSRYFFRSKQYDSDGTKKLLEEINERLKRVEASNAKNNN